MPSLKIQKGRGGPNDEIRKRGFPGIKNKQQQLRGEIYIYLQTTDLRLGVTKRGRGGRAFLRKGRFEKN